MERRNQRHRAEGDLQPERETLTRQALAKNQVTIEAMVNAISSGEAKGALWRAVAYDVKRKGCANGNLEVTCVWQY